MRTTKVILHTIECKIFYGHIRRYLGFFVFKVHAVFRTSRVWKNKLRFFMNVFSCSGIVGKTYFITLYNKLFYELNTFATCEFNILDKYSREIQQLKNFIFSVGKCRESTLFVNFQSQLHVFVPTPPPPPMEPYLSPDILRFYQDVPQQKTG